MCPHGWHRLIFCPVCVQGRAETKAGAYWAVSSALRRFVGKRPTGRIKNKIMRAITRALDELEGGGAR